MTEPSELDREELEAELETLRERVATLESLIEIRGDTSDPALTDVWVAGCPIGKIIEAADKRSKQALDDGGTDADGASREARARMCPIHRSLADWRNHGADLDASEQRAVWLFRQFIRSAVDNGPTAHVESSNKRLTMTSDGARKVCAEYGEELVSKQIGRAMETLVVESIPPEADDPLFTVDPGKPRTVSVNGTRFGEYLRGVGRATDADGTVRTADDASDSVEDVDQQLAELDDAATGFTDTVVSKQNGAASEATEVVRHT